jgi:hypothetical protein
MFSSFLVSWRNYKHIDGTTYKSDFMIGDVLDKAKNRFDYSCIDIDSNNYFRTVETKKKFMQSDDWICIDQFMDISIILSAATLQIKHLLGYSFNEDFEWYFYYSDNPITFHNFIRLVLCKKIAGLDYKVLFLTCEYCPIHQELTYFSKLRQVTVIGLQHGIINEQHSGYMFSNLKSRNVLPDVICVFGEKDKELLTQLSVFEESQVIVTGQPRYDIFYYADDVYSNNLFFEKYSINCGNKLVLWTTQCHGISDEENISNFKAVFGAIKGLKNVFLVIKQHPNEGKKYRQMIDLYLKKYCLNVLIMPQKSDVSELLHACDLMITKSSTTAMEAVALDKPVMILNLSGKPDVGSFVKEKIAVGVYNSEDLINVMKSLLDDDSQLRVNRELYIKNYMYRIDGKSSERVVKVIENCV